jgi:hypothetical protein
MNRLNLALLALALCASVSISSAASATGSAQISGFLSAYIPNFNISHYTVSNLSYGTGNYSILQSGGKYIILNLTKKNATFVTSGQAASNILSKYFASSFSLSASDKANLTADMNAFMTESNPAIKDCLTETGLTENTCTLANGCFSCQTIPVCKKVLSGTGGADEPFALGIMNFSSQETQLTEDYSSYSQIAANITSANAGASLTQLSSLLTSISVITHEMPDNPIFSYTGSYQALASCDNYIPTKAPWYCNALGFCENTNFNYSQILATQSIITTLQEKAVSNATIQTLGTASANQAETYITDFTANINETALQALITKISPGYNSIVANVSVFVNQTGNKNLSIQLNALISKFNSVKAVGGNQSVAKATNTLDTLISSLTTSYAEASKNYTLISSLSSNNTLSLIIKELDFQTIPTGLAELEASQTAINIKLGSSTLNNSQANSIIAELVMIKANASNYNPSSVSGSVVSKGIAGPIVTPILSALNMPVPNKIATAPLIAAVLALIAGLVVLLIFRQLTYAKLRHKKKRLESRVTNAWRLLMIILLLAVIAYAYVSYSGAEQATQFLPISGFISAVHASNTVVVAIESTQTSNSTEIACATFVQSSLKAEGKNATMLHLTNYTCTGNSYPTCYDQILASGTPSIIFNGAKSLTYNGLYGDQLNAGGPLANGNSCELAKILTSTT